MHPFAIGCLLVGGGLSVAFGLRLLWLAYQTRGAPEFWWGCTWLSSAIINGVAAIGGASDSASVYHASRVVVAIFYPLIVLILFVATYRLFRPHSRWALWLCMVVGMIMVGAWTVEFTILGIDTPVGGTPWSLLRFFELTGLMLGLIWVGIETFRHYILFTRQWRIGLVTRLLGIRYLLWFASACSISCQWISEWVGLFFDVPEWVLDVNLPIFVLVSASFLWMAFFPPEALRRRLQEAKPSM